MALQAVEMAAYGPSGTALYLSHHSTCGGGHLKNKTGLHFPVGLQSGPGGAHGSRTNTRDTGRKDPRLHKLGVRSQNL